MSMSLSFNNSLNCNSRYVIFFGQFLFAQSRKFFANRFHLFIGQFSVSVLFSFSVSFRSSVNHVVAMRTKKQMIWIHTRRIVAGVTNVNSLWPFTMCEHPRNSMSQSGCSKLDDSIACWISASFPYPTFRSLFNSYPESISKGSFLWSWPFHTINLTKMSIEVNV